MQKSYIPYYWSNVLIVLLIIYLFQWMPLQLSVLVHTTDGRLYSSIHQVTENLINIEDTGQSCMWTNYNQIMEDDYHITFENFFSFGMTSLGHFDWQLCFVSVAKYSESYVNFIYIVLILDK